MDLHNFHRILLLIYGHVYTTVALYKDTSGTLTSFPGNVPASETVVVLDSNQIASVNPSDIQHLTAITHLFMISNKLTQFLDIRPVANTLTTISLSGNTIQTFNTEYLQGADKLAYIDLSFNQLTVFPDVGDDAKKSLTNIKMNNNPFTSMDLGSLIGFTQLTTLDIQTNQLETIPNTCRSDMWTNGLMFMGSANNLRCDCKMRHLHVNPPSSLKYWPCQSPASLSGQSINSGLQVSQLVCDELEDNNKKTASFTKVKSNFYCSFPYVGNRYRVYTISKCANMCIQTPGCYYFNTQRSDDGSILCDTTSVYATSGGVTVTDYTNWNYYSII